MAIEKKISAGGGMDMDTDERFVAKNDYRKAVNCRIATSDEDSMGTVENVRSNRLALTYDYPDSHGEKTVIGSKEDIDNKAIIYFVHDSNGYHGIYRFDYQGEGTAAILVDNPSNPILNFDKDHLITGINIVGSDEDIFPMGLLYWTDDFNPPRKINIFKAMNNGYSGNIDERTIDAIKYPPLFPPTSNRFLTDKDKSSNQIKEKSWQFKYRYIYDDLEKSAWSPISKNFANEAFQTHYPSQSGLHSFDFNVLPVKFNTGHHTVKRIQIAARTTNGTDDFLLIADIDKENINEFVLGYQPTINFNYSTDALNIPTIITDDSLMYFMFYNNNTYSTIDIIESNKLYDDIPHLSKAQEIVDGNRMVYGNVESGLSVDKVIDYELTSSQPDSQSLSTSTIADELSIQHKVKIFAYDQGSKQRKFKKRHSLMIRIPELPVDPSITSYHLEIENFLFGHISHKISRNSSTSWDNWNWHGGFMIMNLNYQSPSYNNTTYTHSQIVDDLANNLNSAPPGEYSLTGIITGTTHTDTWSQFTWTNANGVVYRYLRLDVTTDDLSPSYAWSPSGADKNKIISRETNKSYVVNGYQWETWASDWYGFDQIARLTQWSGRQYQAMNFAWSGRQMKLDPALNPSAPDGFVNGGLCYYEIDYSNNMFNWCMNSQVTWGAWRALYDTNPNYLGRCGGTMSNAMKDLLVQYQSNHNPDAYCGVESLLVGLDDEVIVPSFKSGANHKFGIVYYDKANRSSSVQLSKNNNIYIPKVTEVSPLSPLGYIGEWDVEWAINHAPPDWATHYQWVYTGNTLTDNFTQFVTDGFYDGAAATKNGGKIKNVATGAGEVEYIASGTYEDTILVDFTNIRKFRERQSGQTSFNYTFAEGDILRLTLSDQQTTPTPAIHTAYEFKILGVVGEGDYLPIFHSDEGVKNPITGNVESEFNDKDFLVLAAEYNLLNGTILDPSTGNLVSGIPLQPDTIPGLVNYSCEIYSPKKMGIGDQTIYHEIGEVGRILDVGGVKVHKRIQGGIYQNQNLTPQTSGTLTAGDTYTIQTYAPGDSFGNVGGTNVSGNTFVATNTTPTTWANGSSLIKPTTGVLKHGDVYLRIRKSHSDMGYTYVESFHYSDKFKSDYYDKGRPNAVLEDFKRSRKHSTCLYSEPYIPNTNINGLNSILPDVNFAEFERSYNSIQKLHSKDNELIIFQEDKVSRAMVKRNIIYNVDGSGNVATSDRVLSQGVPYLGDFGISKNPESFAKFGNRLYFVDIKRGVVIRLSTDGITPISEYKMKDFFTDKFKTLNKNYWETSIRIHGVYDSKYNEYILSLEDVWQMGRGGQWWIAEDGFTIGFSEKSRRWNSFYTFPELQGMSTMGIGFASFKDGNLWMHDEGGGGNTGAAVHYNNFYGQLHNSELWLVSNDVPSNNKVYTALSQESTDIWDVNFETKEGQASSLVTSDFDTRENMHYSDIMNDVNSPGGLIEGDRMRSTSMLAKLKLGMTSTLSKLFAVNFNVFPSHRSNK